ncbi:MAG TPA: sugar transferase, partial [Segetibacter sp.]
MKYQYYAGIDKSQDNKTRSANAVNDCIELYPSLAYKDYNLYIAEDSHQYIRHGLKRSFDLVVSSIALITGSPFFALLVVITKITSGGNVFF